MCLNIHWIIPEREIVEEDYVVSCKIHSPFWANYAYYIFPYIDFMAFAGLPFSLLLVANVLIIGRIFYSRRQARQHLNTNQPDSGQVSQMTIILLGISIAFLVLTGPICCFLLAEMFWRDVSLDIVTASQVYFGFQFCTMLGYLNNALNFWIYCATGSRFRQEVAALFCTKDISTGRDSTNMTN